MNELVESFGFNSELITSLKEILIVLGIGLLLGLEREFSRFKNDDVHLFAGVRTFPIVALMGYLSLLLTEKYSGWIFAAAFLGMISLIAISYAHTRDGQFGTTTEFTAMIVFILGALVFAKHYHLSVSVCVVVAGLLALKPRIHKVVMHLSKDEILSILVFIIITGLILPLLPNKDFGIFGVFNFYKIWLIVSIFVCLNFVAYFLMKYLNMEKSVIITGILGGFASSTATAWFFSRQSGKSSKGGIVESAAVILASFIMFFRLLVWLIILNRTLFNFMSIPIFVIGILGLGMGFWISKKHKTLEHSFQREMGNPINIKEGIFFAFIYVLIQLLVKYTEKYFGNSGIFIASGISGLTDIDAITISMANLHKTSISTNIAVAAILIAAFANTLVKYGFCLIFGNKNMRKFTSLVFVPIFLIGIAYIIYILRI